MQTIYATTTHFIRHQGNMVDLGEFRRKQALARAGSLAPRLEPEEASVQAAAPVLPVLPAAPRVRNRPAPAARPLAQIIYFFLTRRGRHAIIS